MQLESPLGQPARLLLAGLASLLSLILAYVAVSNFIVNSLLIPAVTLNFNEVEAAARYFPRSGALQALVASNELAADRDYEAAASRAESAALRASSLTPARYDFRLLVASAREMKGDRGGAEAALREALALAPNRAETHWRMANVLVRQGKLDEASPFFSRAVGARPVLLAQTLALVWNVSSGKVEKMEAAVGDSPKGLRDLAFFLIQRGLVSEGVRVFNRIDRAHRLASDESGAFVSGLMSIGQLELAHGIWGDLVTSNSDDLKPLIFNGNFETDPRASLDQFDWMLAENGHFRPSLAGGTAHTGSRALRLDFKGVDTMRIEGEIRQQLLVRPGARYRLSCWVKTNALQTTEGPRLVVTNIDRVTQIASSEPIAAGTEDWREIRVEFTVPVSLATILVQVKRIPKFSYDEPTRGTIWFDDLLLTEM